MEQLSDILYSLSDAFLIPTLAGVLALFVTATYLVGQCLSEALDRRSTRAALDRLRREGTELDRFLQMEWRGLFARLKEALVSYPLASQFADKAVADIENALRARVERISILSRTGPILGLVGTLIPLQPALAGLAEGNMQQMAANLLIGFTSTVTGLLAGGTAFAVGVLARTWARADIVEMRFLVELWRRREEARFEDTDAENQVRGSELEPVL